MEGMITIENLTGRHLQYRMDHQAVCVKVGKCFCQKGRRGTVTTTIHIPGGVGVMSAPLPPAVTLIAELKRDASQPNQKIRIHGAKAQVGKAKAKVKAGSDEPEKKGGGGRKGKSN